MEREGGGPSRDGQDLDLRICGSLAAFVALLEISHFPTTIADYKCVVGGVKKGKVYGLGAQPSSCHPSPLLSGASTSQTSEEMEKFMEKHMVESDDGEEEMDSDEEKIMLWLFRHFLRHLDLF
uniref:Uncharacterized protein n=1 Tax=Solanum tuberosum TaxID=4113 RepID=M0ZZ99_SOLTU